MNLFTLLCAHTLSILHNSTEFEEQINFSIIKKAHNNTPLTSDPIFSQISAEQNHKTEGKLAQQRGCLQGQLELVLATCHNAF